jgi:hypothetical protein
MRRAQGGPDPPRELGIQLAITALPQIEEKFLHTS